MKNKKAADNQTNYMPLGMCLGISIGTAIGVATGKLSLYMPICMCIGLCIGSFADARSRKKDSDTTQEEEKPDA